MTHNCLFWPNRLPSWLRDGLHRFGWIQTHHFSSTFATVTTDFYILRFLRTEFYCLLGSLENNSGTTAVLYTVVVNSLEIGLEVLRHLPELLLLKIWDKIPPLYHLKRVFWGAYLGILYRANGRAPYGLKPSYYNGILLLAELEASDALEAVFITNHRFSHFL